MCTPMPVALEVWSTQPLPPSSSCFAIQINQCGVLAYTNVRSSETFRPTHSQEFSVFLTRTDRSGTAHKDSYLWFGILSAVVVKIFIFRAITPSSTLEVDRYSGETRRVHLQGWRQAVLATWFTLVAECSSETRLSFDGLHGFTSKKRKLFKNNCYPEPTQCTIVFLETFMFIGLSRNSPAFLAPEDSLTCSQNANIRRCSKPI
jgi:hypothetical protein